MSWDISISPLPDDEDYQGHEVDNYTWNVGPMYREAIPEWNGFNEWHGLRCEDVADRLLQGIIAMRQNPEKYRKLNPSNGWGNYEGALEFLEKIEATCRKWPHLYLQVS